MGRIVQSDLDCADCACRICARSTYNDCSNPECEWAECSPCENCVVGVSLLIETEDDCDRFLPDFDDLPEREREKALYRTINRKLAAAAPEDPVSWSFLEEYAEGKRYNYASDFVADAKAEWERRQRYGDCD